MSEMVERVAQAICGDDNPANILTIHRIRARAAIEAMREPTGLMKDAGAESFEFGSDDCASLNGQPSKAWRAMIDEALK